MILAQAYVRGWPRGRPHPGDRGWGIPGADLSSPLDDLLFELGGKSRPHVVYTRHRAAAGAAPSVRRVSVTASASGSGKTTFGRELARRLDVPFVELDALVHGPNWTETPDDVLRRRVEEVLAGDGWVIDGGYRRKIGHLVFENAEVVVWIDLPLRVWLPRLFRRTVRRLRGHEEIWNGNRETLAGAFWGREALIPYAVRMHFSRRKRYPAELASFPVVRLRTRAEMDAFLERAGPTGGAP